jgi:hypothetical protein
MPTDDVERSVVTASSALFSRTFVDSVLAATSIGGDLSGIPAAGKAAGSGSGVGAEGAGAGARAGAGAGSG